MLMALMRATLISCLLLGSAVARILAADFTPGKQRFRQELARAFNDRNGSPAAGVQLVEASPDGVVRAFAAGGWHEFKDGKWNADPDLAAKGEGAFVFADAAGRPVHAQIPWREVRQLVRVGSTNVILATDRFFTLIDGKSTASAWTEKERINQLAAGLDGRLLIAASDGLFEQIGTARRRLEILDAGGRCWASRDVLGVGFDSDGHLWFATRAGVGCRLPTGWKFYEGKDGLPWNDFTGVAGGTEGEVWFATHLGVIRFGTDGWHYRQGRRWLPQDDVIQLAVDKKGSAWAATSNGVGCIERQAMTLAEKAEYYEQEIERYVQRTPFGYVAEAALQTPADKSTANPNDSDNDGLWTAMYGAGECFAYGATKAPKAKARATKAFEALRFLQKVTQGGNPAPPKGFVARTIRPTEAPDPNVGRLEEDRRSQKEHDKLWKVYEPRWPKSADGKWFWKSDTSSDELDGHYFLYPLYYDLCAETEAERERVREVVRDLTDHLVEHHFFLVDHDGKPTRWGIFAPEVLNHDPTWWPERGLNSLSMLSYLAVAAHVTGDRKYVAASRDLIDRHGYGQNLMYAKVQHGPGSGNQSDDEMAFMSYYSLLRYSTDEALKAAVRYSYFSYWANEAPEMNPFFNFAYAAQNLDASGSDPWNSFSLSPWRGWLEDSMATLYGFPLDRLDWAHRNSHRLDIVRLTRVQARDLDDPEPQRTRGRCVNGKVLPVENRHFNHWNTDPYQLDYGGHGGELAAGTVYLLPYYMGLYHGFIEKPAK
jgi:hypothetical protein